MHHRDSKMVIQLEHPCRVRYRRRDAIATVAKHTEASDSSLSEPIAVEVDLDLCQGHGVCVAEAPSRFELVKETNKVRILPRAGLDSDNAAVEAAVKYCPTHALRRVALAAAQSSEQPKKRPREQSRELTPKE